MYILIFAGGSGTRLWPASRSQSPKQVLRLLNNKTLLENTYDRCAKLVSKDRIFIATLEKYHKSIKNLLPDISKDNYSLEPVLRDRGPAIGLACLLINHRNPNSTFMTMWSDNELQSKKGYLKELLVNSEKYLRLNPNITLTVGVKPTEPHTGYGYIEKSQKISNKFSLPLFKVKSFQEKPNLKTATKFTKSPNYLWNTGFFLWKSSYLLELYQIHLPEVYEILMKIKPKLGTSQQQRAINYWYPKCPKVEVEQGLIEKIKDEIYTLELDLSWNDIGSWKTIKEIQSKNSADNISSGLHIDYNSSGLLAINNNPKQLLATLNLKDIAVIVTKDAILVADNTKSEDLKLLIKKIKSRKDLKRFL